jgi:hypothetical protein
MAKGASLMQENSLFSKSFRLSQIHHPNAQSLRPAPVTEADKYRNFSRFCRTANVPTGYRKTYEQPSVSRLKRKPDLESVFLLLART